MSTKMDIRIEPIGSHEIQGNTRQARENARDEVLVVCRDTAKCLFGRLDFRQSARTQRHMALVSANMLALYQLCRILKFHIPPKSSKSPSHPL